MIDEIVFELLSLKVGFAEDSYSFCVGGLSCDLWSRAFFGVALRS